MVADEAPVDADVIASLRELSSPGEPSILDEMIGLFLEDTSPRLDDLCAGFARGDAAAVADIAHAIKGSCSNFGATRMHGLSRDVELAGRGSALDGAGKLIDDLLVEYARVRAALLAELGR